MNNHDVIVVGAGLAGLAAARRLREKGYEPVVFERSNSVGGRVHTDMVDGFRLDHGFQTIFTAYPEASRVLNFGALDLCQFDPGAVIRIDGEFHRVSDPMRCPGEALRSFKAPVGSMKDKLAVLKMRHDVSSIDTEDLFARPESTALARFSEIGFSPRMIERFLGPLFTGMTLDPELGFSSRHLDFIFSMLSTGDAAVPALGMGEIPRQLEGDLPAGTIQCGVGVESVAADHVIVDGSRVGARAVIVATDAHTADRLTNGQSEYHGSMGVSTWWIAADEAPIRRPTIVFNGEGGVLNSLAVLSQVSPQYSPDHRALIAASTPFVHATEHEMRAALTNWYGSVVDTWETIRVDRIEQALPVQPLGLDPDQSVRLPSGLFVAGDHRQNASMNGALVSGRRAAESVVARLCRDC